MTTFSPTESLRLSAAFAEAHEQATEAPWKPNVWIETDGNEWRATGPGHEEHASDYGSEPGSPDEQAAQRDAAAIVTLRNNAASASAQLAAAVEEVERLRVEGPLWLGHAIAVLHECVDQTNPDCPIGIALTRAGLERVPYRSKLAYHDLEARLAAVTALCERAVVIGQTALSDEGHDHGECEHWNELVRIHSELAKGAP